MRRWFSISVAASLLWMAGCSADQDTDSADQIKPGTVRDLQGTWHMTFLEEGGNRGPVSGNVILTVTPDQMTLKGEVMSERGTDPLDLQGSYTLDRSKEPKAFTWTTQRGVLMGIYKIQGDALQICTAGERPTDFTTTGQPGRTLMIFSHK
jgi:uncharacterized protein (TIGR03067 family)